jgi:hypothetical protein
VEVNDRAGCLTCSQGVQHATSLAVGISISCVDVICFSKGAGRRRNAPVCDTVGVSPWDFYSSAVLLLLP